ncbi:MAG TPA: tetratricopeptide repeat protein [Polyangiaceae bacterium]|jgi:hypothetical protein
MNTYIALAAAFQIWMLVDAYRRRVNAYWYFIILVVPFGALIYFGFVKLSGTNSTRPVFAPGSRAPSYAELERRVQETPSVINKLALAELLLEDGKYEAAVSRFRDVLNHASDNKEALHGIARAFLALGRPQEASDELARLMELDAKFRDYSAALDYAEALWQSGERDDAIGLLTGLVGVSGRLNHRVALAHYCKEAGQYGAARAELESALREFDRSPDYVQRREQQWADRARRALRELPDPS